MKAKEPVSTLLATRLLAKRMVYTIGTKRHARAKPMMPMRNPYMFMEPSSLRVSPVLFGRLSMTPWLALTKDTNKTSSFE